MDLNTHSSEKIKKANSIISLLYAKRLDKTGLRELFLKNYASVPQEHRLILWKFLLGISNSFHPQFLSSDCILTTHYAYLRHVIRDVLQLKTKNENELNLYIYLIDKCQLPLNESEPLTEQEPFVLIYKQMTEILDDSNDFECECYYLTVELFEFLQANLKAMMDYFFLNYKLNLVINVAVIEKLLITGMAGLFKDIKLYHIIWDRLIMGETEILVFILISLLENCKEEQLKQISNFSKFSKSILLDETKILKSAIKNYKACHANTQLSSLILNYFNSK